MTSEKPIRYLIIAAIISAAGIFYITTIRAGHEWGDDFSMYIMHARNIAEGAAYGQTGYIFNPMRPSLGPATYPPVFPAMLAPVYKFWGPDLAAMKAEIIVIFLLFLFAYYLAFKDEMTFPFAALATAAVAFNPYFWEFKDSIMSEVPFLLWTYLAFFLIRRMHEPDGARAARWLYAASAGLTVYLAYGTRSIGMVLVPSLLVHDFLRNRRPTAPAAFAALIALFLMGLQSLFMHSDGSYLKLLEPNTQMTAIDLVKYVTLLSSLWDNGNVRIISSVMSVALSGFAAYGIYARARRGVALPELFLLFYAIFLTAFCLTSKTVPISRHIIPIMPLYVFYAVYGIHCLVRDGGWERAAVAALGVALIATYAAKYARKDFGPMTEGVEKRETVEFFDHIRRNTGERAVFIFRRPRALALFTGRRASVYHEPADDKMLWAYFKEIGATHVVLSRLDRDYLRAFIDKYRDELDETYSNPDFKVYRIRGRGV